tara:strand:+ start:23 stop:190 length:168 start_codon:yes stop_codon:yes gene_type:complete
MDKLNNKNPKNLTLQDLKKVKQVVKKHVKTFNCMPDTIKINGIIYTKNNYIKFLD